MKSTAAVVVRGRRFLKASRGANLVEYILLVGVIAIFCLAGFKIFGRKLNEKISQQTETIDVVDSKMQDIK